MRLDANSDSERASATSASRRKLRSTSNTCRSLKARAAHRAAGEVGGLDDEQRLVAVDPDERGNAPRKGGGQGVGADLRHDRSASQLSRVPRTGAAATAASMSRCMSR